MAMGAHLERAQASVAKPSKASVPRNRADAQHAPNPSLGGGPPAWALDTSPGWLPTKR